MTKVKVVGLRPSLTLLLTIAETLQPVIGCHKISAGVAGDLGADPLGFRIQTCLKNLQATEAEESVWSSCVYTRRGPGGVAGTYLVVLLHSVSRTVVGRTRFVDECRPAGPHQDQRPEQSHELLHLPRGTLHRSSAADWLLFSHPALPVHQVSQPRPHNFLSQQKLCGQASFITTWYAAWLSWPPTKCCLLTTAGLMCCGKSTAADLKIPKSADGTQLKTGAHKLEDALWRQKQQSVAPKTAWSCRLSRHTLNQTCLKFWRFWTYVKWRWLAGSARPRSAHSLLVTCCFIKNKEDMLFSPPVTVVFDSDHSPKYLDIKNKHTKTVNSFQTSRKMQDGFRPVMETWVLVLKCSVVKTATSRCSLSVTVFSLILQLSLSVLSWLLRYNTVIFSLCCLFRHPLFLWSARCGLAHTLFKPLCGNSLLSLLLIFEFLKKHTCSTQTRRMSWWSEVTQVKHLAGFWRCLLFTFYIQQVNSV